MKNTMKSALKNIAFLLAFALSTASFTGAADASEHCKKVRINISNQTGQTVQVYDIDYYDFGSGVWRSEPTKNRILNHGGGWTYKKRLEKVGAEQTQVRVQYRTARDGKWKDKHASVSATAVCYKNSAYNVTLR